MKLLYVLSAVTYLSLALTDDAALKEFVSGNNLFTASVYKEIKKTVSGNFFVSPFSAESVLALAQSGARDETAEEMKSALHLPDSQEKIKNAFKTVHSQLKLTNLVKTANKIYIKKNFEIRDEFKKGAIDVFEADLENIDFSKEEEAAQAMNNWVEEHTEHKIQNLISPMVLSPDTRSILINALYFKGNWTEPFVKELTKPRDFYKNGKELIQVPKMHLKTKKNYYESAELKAKFLELDFVSGDVSLVIVLPNEKDGLETLESQLEKTIETPKFTQEDVSIFLPKLKMRSEIKFKPILQKLGIEKVFNDDQADLSGIAGKKGDLVINQVLQKTFIDLDEEGVEAAAATFVDVIVPESAIDIYPPPLKEFRVDHPFLFYIKVKNLIFFAGRVVDPSEMS